MIECRRPLENGLQPRLYSQLHTRFLHAAQYTPDGTTPQQQCVYAKKLSLY